jgi:hypothetical protein
MGSGGASDDLQLPSMLLVAVCACARRATRIAPRLVDEPGRPPAILCDVCIAIADELRACAALTDPFHVPYCGQMLCVSVTG